MAEGRELSVDEEEALKSASECYRAEKIALRLVSRAEQNSSGLRAKLERRGFSDRTAKTVVSRFLEKGLLDDGRYAEIWIRSRLSGGKVQSPQWLLANLVKRGISVESSRKSLEKVLDPEAEYDLLVRYLEKAGPEKSRNSPGKNPVSLRSQLKSSGFSWDVLTRYFD